MNPGAVSQHRGLGSKVTPRALGSRVPIPVPILSLLQWVRRALLTMTVEDSDLASCLRLRLKSQLQTPDLYFQAHFLKMEQKHQPAESGVRTLCPPCFWLQGAAGVSVLAPVNWLSANPTLVTTSRWIKLVFETGRAKNQEMPALLRQKTGDSEKSSISSPHTCAMRATRKSHRPQDKT